MNEAIFFAFVGSAALVAGLALLFGSPQKVYASAVIIGLLLCSNIIFGAYLSRRVSAVGLLIGFAALDMLAAAMFARFYRPRAIEKNRWAAIAAALQFFTCAANVATIFVERMRHSAVLFIVLNVVSITVMVVCAIAFTPKNWREAQLVLKLKLFYIRNDLFGLRTMLRRKTTSPLKNDETHHIAAHVGEKLRVARLMKNLTREELAVALGVSRRHIERYENAAGRMPVRALLDAARFLGADVSYFFDDLHETAPASAAFALQATEKARARLKP